LLITDIGIDHILDHLFAVIPLASAGLVRKVVQLIHAQEVILNNNAFQCEVNHRTPIFLMPSVSYTPFFSNVRSPPNPKPPDALF
ncbi:hypothetical protein CKY04_24685, partial [Photorhabdus sp. S8-52]